MVLIVTADTLEPVTKRSDVKAEGKLHAIQDNIISRHTCCATVKEEELDPGCKEYMSKDNQKLIAIRPKRSVAPANHKSLK